MNVLLSSDVLRACAPFLVVEMPLLDPRSGPSYGAIEQRDHIGNMDEGDQLLRNEFENEGEGELSSVETEGEAQEGVLKIEAINMTWTTRSLIVAYIRFVWLATALPRFYRASSFNADLANSIFLMAFCTSLEGQTVMSLSAYATSAFSKHSLISTVLVVQNVVNGELHSDREHSREYPLN